MIWPPDGRVVFWGCFMILQVLLVAGVLVSPFDLRVVDGDTVRQGPDLIRLVGFDAPETRFAGCEAEYRLGVLAGRHLAALLKAAGEVRIERLDRVDKYRRVLARLYLDGKNVADLMVSQGWARAYDGGRRASWCAGFRKSGRTYRRPLF